MLQKIIDDIRDSAGATLRLTSLAAAMAFCLFVTVAFLCAAAFVFVLDRYGLLEACLAGAAVFFLAAILAAICYAHQKRQIERKPAAPAKSSLQTALSDPMMLAVALQAVRTIGFKRLIPLLAIGGIALGLLAKGHQEPQTPKPE